MPKGKKFGPSLPYASLVFRKTLFLKKLSWAAITWEYVCLEIILHLEHSSFHNIFTRHNLNLSGKGVGLLNDMSTTSCVGKILNTVTPTKSCAFNFLTGRRADPLFREVLLLTQPPPGAVSFSLLLA